MTEPIVVEIPHKLGLAEARARVDRGIGKLAGMIPGGRRSITPGRGMS